MRQYDVIVATLLTTVVFRVQIFNLTHDFVSRNVGNDIWGWTDPENGDEYAIMCMNCGTSFVRLTPNPEEPTVLAYLPTA